MRNIFLLGDRDANPVTHRELDAAVGLLPSGVKARWVGTDTPDAARTSKGDAALTESRAHHTNVVNRAST